MRILVAYDGSLNSKLALKAGLHKGNGNELVVLHTFNSNMSLTMTQVQKRRSLY